jgi:hypothetical protein
VTETSERESLWNRLRRRKVVQWGLVYLAASWGFLQGLLSIARIQCDGLIEVVGCEFQ